MTNEEKFRKLWRELAKLDYSKIPNRVDKKIELAKELDCYQEMPSFKGVCSTSIFACPACAEVVLAHNNLYCGDCPITWSDSSSSSCEERYFNKPPCEKHKSLYHSWKVCAPDLAPNYATQIAELPWSK